MAGDRRPRAPGARAVGLHEACALELDERLRDLAAERLFELGGGARLGREHHRERTGGGFGARHGDSATTTVWSSVKACITCAPPTRPMPLPVPARPPKGRCASQ